MKLFRRLLSYGKPYVGLFILCFVLMFTATLTDLAKPYIMKLAIDDLLTPQSTLFIKVPDKSGQLVTSKSESYDILKAPTPSQQTYKMILNDHIAYMIPSEITVDQSTVWRIDASGAIIQGQTGSTSADPIENNSYQRYIKSSKSKLLQLTVGFVALLLLAFVVNYVQVLILNVTSQKIIHTMRMDLFGHIIGLPLKFFEINPVGRLVTRLTNDLNTINEMYTVVLLNLFKDAILLVGIVIMMFIINYKLALISMATMPLVLLIAYTFRINIRVVQRETKRSIAIVNSKLSEYIQGMSIIQHFDVEKEFYKDFDDSNQAYMHFNLKEIHLFGLFRPTMTFLYTLGLAILLYYGSLAVLKEALPFGVLFAFTNYLDMFYRPIFDFSEKFNIMESAMASAERLFLLSEERNPLLLSKEVPKPSKGASITFEHVSFSYLEEPHQMVIKEMDFHIREGETIAIVGSTGSGKTTLSNLIARFYDPQEGRILVNGEDLKTLDLQAHRARIGVVLQDVFLFSSSVLENIRLLNPALEEALIQQVIESAQLESVMEKLPNGYRSILSEGGAELSQGEKQLISFARALAYNPQILILDEATSSIDTHTEERIQHVLFKLIEDRTTLIIAHRLSTIKHCDRIFVMHKGELIEEGTHDALLAQNGTYAKLYALQFESEA